MDDNNSLLLSHKHDESYDYDLSEAPRRLGINGFAINEVEAARMKRHPEKANNKEQISPKKPPWLKVRAPQSKGYQDTLQIVKDHGLKTVCQEGSCPNIGECWQKKHATFMIMGEVCTRGCAFCNVATGRPEALDIFEPLRIARAIEKLKLDHVVITSVDRDDLEDGGAGHFAATIRAIKRCNSNTTTIEVLIPDFLKKSPRALEAVIEAGPEICNHNIETVPSLYPEVRPGARYFHSLRLLQRAKEINPKVFTKSGIMVGLGESKEEILQVMDDMRSADVDFITIGQYLQPTLKHRRIHNYRTPEEFENLGMIGRSKGFLMVSSSPLTRSSYHAGEWFSKLKAARDANT